METILVVDDSIEVLETLSLLLESAGYSVVCTCEPERAIRLCHEINFDAVICDLCLESVPGAAPLSPLAGLDVICNLTNDFPKLPVIAMSGIIDREILDRMKTSGISAVLSKPFERDELLLQLSTATARE